MAVNSHTCGGLVLEILGQNVIIIAVVFGVANVVASVLVTVSVIVIIVVVVVFSIILIETVDVVRVFCCYCFCIYHCHRFSYGYPCRDCHIRSRIIMGVGSANDRSRHYVTPSFIGRAHTRMIPAYDVCWYSGFARGWISNYLAHGARLAYDVILYQI